MKKILLISPGYPSEEDIYNNAFVHSRIIQYQKNGLDINVFSLDKQNNKDYTYEGVKIIRGSHKKLKDVLINQNYENIVVHFGFRKTLKTIVKHSSKSKLFIFVHGVEALGWYRRLFTFNIKRPHRFIGYILFNTLQMIYLHAFIREKSIDKTFIFVSKWMKDIMEKDTLSINKIKKYSIIPNVIDDKTFEYKEKTEDKRLKILSIRPYSSKKYANDISVKTVVELSTKPYFNELSFTFYGSGALFEKTLKPIKKFHNVTIHEKFLSHKEIVEAHAEHGVMLIPTRQDAQGVSMCEAMSSGLLILTSNNTAIPEFVENSYGYLANDYLELVKAVDELYYNPDKYLKMSELGSIMIKKKCSPEIVIKKEIELINS